MDIAYILYSAHTLFEYKLALEILNLGSKHSEVFYTLSELSNVIDTIRIKYFLTLMKFE